MAKLERNYLKIILFKIKIPRFRIGAVLLALDAVMERERLACLVADREGATTELFGTGLNKIHGDPPPVFQVYGSLSASPNCRRNLGAHFGL